MRVQEIITETNLVEARVRYEDLVLDYRIDGANVDVRAIVDGKQVGYVIFNRDGRTLFPDDLAVDEEYRGRGIAKKMYDWVKSLPQGFRIIRGDQTSMGKRFWDKNRGEGGNVWEESVAEGLDAEAYKEKLLSTLPQMMRFYEKNVKGWKPSQEQMLAAIETAYTVMKHTGDVKQAGKAMMDELNTLHRMSQGQQGVAEGLEHNLKDLDDVADWLNTTTDKLNVVVKQEPIEKFIKQIREMYGTYGEFPKDEERTNHILKLLKRGAKPLPMYVEAGDPDLFVMEGRHRMVAFWLAGMTTIPVAYVSIKSQQGVAENFADGRNPGRKGLAKRMGVPTKASVSRLRQIAKSSSGEKQRMAHWLANMKAGRKK